MTLLYSEIFHGIVSFPCVIAISKYFLAAAWFSILTLLLQSNAHVVLFVRYCRLSELIRNRVAKLNNCYCQFTTSAGTLLL